MEGFGIGLGILAIALGFLIMVAIGGAVVARSKHAVACPRDGSLVVIRCRAAGGATYALGGRQLHVATCDHWPGRAGCPEGCVAQLTAAPTIESVEGVQRERRSRRG